jgi:hypothetical protein
MSWADIGFWVATISAAVGAATGVGTLVYTVRMHDVMRRAAKVQDERRLFRRSAFAMPAPPFTATASARERAKSRKARTLADGSLPRRQIEEQRKPLLGPIRQQLDEAPGIEVRTCVKLQRLGDAMARNTGGKQRAGVGHRQSAAGRHFDLALRAFENPRIVTMGQRLAVLNALVIGEIPGMHRRPEALHIRRRRAGQHVGLQDLAPDQRGRLAARRNGSPGRTHRPPGRPDAPGWRAQPPARDRSKQPCAGSARERIGQIRRRN